MDSIHLIVNGELGGGGISCICDAAATSTKVTLQRLTEFACVESLNALPVAGMLLENVDVCCGRAGFAPEAMEYLVHKRGYFLALYTSTTTRKGAEKPSCLQQLKHLKYFVPESLRASVQLVVVHTGNADIDLTPIMRDQFARASVMTLCAANAPVVATSFVDEIHKRLCGS